MIKHGDSDSTFHTWLQLSSSCVCLNSPCTKYRSYLLKLISICGHFLTVNNHHYDRCYVQYIVPLRTFLEFYTHLEGNSARSFENAFLKCSRALNMMFSKTSCFWWMSLFLRLLSHLKFRSSIPTSHPMRNPGFWSASSRPFVWFGLVPSQSDSLYLIYILWITIPRAEYYAMHISWHLIKFMQFSIVWLFEVSS